MNYTLAVFDLDGTILNTLEDLKNSTNFALKKNGMPERTLQEVRAFVGNGIRRLIERAVAPGTSPERTEKVLADFTDHYREHCADFTCPYEGIREVIETLRNRGIKTAVVSNKADFAVQSLCRDYFPGLFDFTAGEKEGIRKKPYPDSVLSVLDNFHTERKNAVYIGDSEVDLETSRNAGVDIIMVGWGFRDEEFLIGRGASCVLHRPEEILDRIR